MSPPVPRKQFVDNAKGITILLVVIEHNAFIYKYHIISQAIILSFHMPLFYFVSGMFFSSREDLTVVAYKRFHSLIKPYLSACLLFFLLKAIKGLHVQGMIPFAAGVAYGTGESLSWPYQQLWFLTSLFVTVLMCKVLYVFLQSLQQRWLRCVALGLILAAGVVIIHQQWAFPYGGLPWNIDLLGITVFFYALGFELRQWIFKIKNESMLYFFISLFFFAVLHYSFTITLSDPDALNLYLRKYDNFLVNSMEAICGILLVIFLSIYLAEHFPKITGWLTYVGFRSLSIFIFHELFMPYIRDIGKFFLQPESFVLFAFSVILTVILALLTHELIARLPVVRYLLLNKRAVVGR